MPKGSPPGLLGLEDRSDLIGRRIYKILESVTATQLTRRVDFEEGKRIHQISVQMALTIIAGRLVLSAVTMGQDRSDRSDIVYDGMGEFHNKIAPHAVNLVREDRKKMRRAFGFEESVNLRMGTQDNEVDLELLEESLLRIDKLITLADIEASRVVRKHSA